MKDDTPQSEKAAHLRAQNERLREQIRKNEAEVAVLDTIQAQHHAELLAIERAKKITIGLGELAEASIDALKAGEADLPSVMRAFEEAAADAKRFYLRAEDVDEIVAHARAAFVVVARQGGAKA